MNHYHPWVRFVFAGFLLIGAGCATGAPKIAGPCLQDEARRAARSEELQRIVAADQADRAHWQEMTESQMGAMASRDVERRERVGEIFGEGCFSTAPDYAAAALIFQHGDSPDHSYQTFIWSRRGVELGDEKQKDLLAVGLDRYLTRTGRKQLFASQASASKAGGCYCLDQVERSFPDKLRREYTGRTLAGARKWVEGMNAGKSCPPPAECEKILAPTRRGSVPGFW